MEDLIPAKDFCIQYNLEYSFIDSLNDHGLIEITTVQEQVFIPVNELQKLERIVRLHNDLQINLEGLEAIMELLQKVETMQDEIVQMRNKVRFYEANLFLPQ